MNEAVLMPRYFRDAEAYELEKHFRVNPDDLVSGTTYVLRVQQEKDDDVIFEYKFRYDDMAYLEDTQLFHVRGVLMVKEDDGRLTPYRYTLPVNTEGYAVDPQSARSGEILRVGYLLHQQPEGVQDNTAEIDAYMRTVEGIGQ